MSAPAPKAQATAAGKFADEAEALGWTVERIRGEDGDRIVRAYRNGEEYELAWTLNDRGNLVYAGGDHFADDASDDCTPVLNVKAALRDMAMHRSSTGALLPFDPEHDDDAEILSAVAGREIEWRTSFGTTESASVPRGGVHLKITQGKAGDNGGARVLNFADPVHTGFRSVYIDQITKVR